MTIPERVGVGPAVRQLQDKAYFLDLLGDSHNGLGHPDAAIEAYQQAAQGFKEQGSRCCSPVTRNSLSISWTHLTSGWPKPAYLGRGGAARGHQDRSRPARPAEAQSPEAGGTGRFLGMPGTNGEPRWLSEDEQQAWRATVNLSQLLMRQLDRDLNAHGLNGHDYEILVELSEAPDNRLRMTELADATSQSRSRLSHQISRMESRGLVRRDNCEGDKRGTFAVLTNLGMDTIKRVAPDHVENVRRHFIDRLTPRQLAEVSDAFGPIVDYLRKIRDRD
jgi:DNA-binding MarR family transcriptional regulator